MPRPYFLFAVCLLLFSAVFLTVSLPGCGDPPPGSGAIDGIDLGLRLELHLNDLARQEGLDAERLARVRTLFNRPPQGLDSLRIYRARTTLEEEGALDLRVALLPLQGASAGGFLAVAVGEDGAVYRSRLWGASAFDDDPESAWENFWRQFEYHKTRGVIAPDNALSDSAVDQFWMRLQADSSQGLGIQMLYRHAQNMVANNYLIRRTMALTGRGEVPAPDWYEHYADAFAQLDTMAERLQPLIGQDAASQYTSVTREARALLEPLGSHARASDAGKARSAMAAFRRRTCGTCHNIEDHALGEGDLRDALMAAFDEHGMRRDLYRVGYDVWPVPGEEEASQEIASALKAVLLVLGPS